MALTIKLSKQDQELISKLKIVLEENTASKVLLKSAHWVLKYKNKVDFLRKRNKYLENELKHIKALLRTKAETETELQKFLQSK